MATLSDGAAAKFVRMNVITILELATIVHVDHITVSYCDKKI